MSVSSQFSDDAWGNTQVPPSVQAGRDATAAQIVRSEPTYDAQSQAANRRTVARLSASAGGADPDSSATAARPDSAQDGSYDAYVKAYDAAPDKQGKLQAGLDYASSLKANPSASHIQSQFAADAAPVKAIKDAKAETFTATGSDAENALAGAGKAVSDMGLGAKQLADIPAKWLENKFPGISKWSQSIGFPSAASSAESTNAEVADSRQRDAQLMNTGAGVAGNIGGNVAMTLLPAAGLAKLGVPGAAALVNPSTYGAAVASGAVQGALQPTTEDESKLRNTAIGGVAGGIGNAAVNAIGRVAAPVGQALSGAHAKAVQVLQDAGIPLDAAQRTGSAFLNKLRSSFSDNPFTAGAQSDLHAVQQSAYNKAVLGTVGEQANAATPDVMAAAAKRINGVFDDTLSRTKVNATNDFSFLNRVTDIQRSAQDSEKTPVSNFVNRILGAADQNGQIPGQVAYGIKKDLDAISNTQDSTLNYWARSLNSALKDQMSSSMTPADAAAFNTARAQFAKLKTIEPAIDRVGGGDISASKLANTFATKQNRQFSIYGRGDTDLVDLAQSGNMLLKDKAPNSGTASRMAVQLGLGAAVGGGVEASQGDYGDALKHAAWGAGAMYALPKAAQSAMNAPAMASYLAKGMPGTTLRSIMLSPQTSPLVGGVARRTAQSLSDQRLSELMK